MDAYAFCNAWNHDKLLPKAYVHDTGQGDLILAGDITTDLEHGVAAPPAGRAAARRDRHEHPSSGRRGGQPPVARAVTVAPSPCGRRRSRAKPSHDTATTVAASTCIRVASRSG